MNEEQAKKFLRRAKLSANKWGFAEFADDIAQEVLLRFCEGRGEHQTIDQCVIDVVRRMFGRPSTPGFVRKQSLVRAESIFDEDGAITVEDCSGMPLGDGLDFERIASMLSGADRMIIILRFRYGLSEIEIGDLFELTESRISQRIRAILIALKHMLSTGPVRKRSRLKRSFPKHVDIDTSELAFDPGKVGWLKL